MWKHSSLIRGFKYRRSNNNRLPPAFLFPPLHSKNNCTRLNPFPSPRIRRLNCESVRTPSTPRASVWNPFHRSLRIHIEGLTPWALYAPEEILRSQQKLWLLNLSPISMSNSFCDCRALLYLVWAVPGTSSFIICLLRCFTLNRDSRSLVRTKVCFQQDFIPFASSLSCTPNEIL